MARNLIFALIKVKQRSVVPIKRCRFTTRQESIGRQFQGLALVLTEFASFVHRGSLEGHFRIGGGVRSDPVCPKSFIQTYLFLQAGVLAQKTLNDRMTVLFCF